MQVRVDPGAVGRLDVLRHPVRALPVPPAVVPERAQRRAEIGRRLRLGHGGLERGEGQHADTIPRSAADSDVGRAVD